MCPCRRGSKPAEREPPATLALSHAGLINWPRGRRLRKLNKLVSSLPAQRPITVFQVAAFMLAFVNLAVHVAVFV